MSDSSSTTLLYSSRFYRYVKSSAITNVTDAYVELITNSQDAYLRMQDNPPESKLIACIMNYHDVSITVYDQAVGLDAERMVECFGQVGTFTSFEDARGYFSRGAKDITALGDATFTCVKDSKLSQCTLTNNDIFTVHIRDRTITDEERKLYDIPENGVHVTLKLKNDSFLPELSTVGVGVSLITDFYSLRTVMSSPNIYLKMCVVSPQNVQLFNGRLQYQSPEVDKVLIDEVLHIHGYPENVTASFKLYLLKESQDEPLYDRLMKFGVLVSSGNAIHEVTTFYNDARYHPAINKVYGVLECSYINDLMYEFDNGVDNPDNSFPILDNSRLRGLDRKHPFTKALFRQPYRQLLYVLESIYQGNVSQNPLAGELNYLLNNLNLLVNNIFAQYLDHDQLFSLDSKANRLVTYHQKRERNVVEQGEDAEYKFNNMGNIIENQADGDLNPVLPNITVAFVDNQVIKYAYRIYQIYSVIHLDINAKFTIIKDILQFIPETNLYKILDFPRLVVYLTDLITEALTRHILLQRNERATVDNTKEHNFNDLFINFEKIQAAIKPQLYSMLSNRSILEQIVLNEE